MVKCDMENKKTQFCSKVISCPNGMIQRAAGLAYDYHYGQLRKYSLEPYIVHPFDVYEKLLTEMGNKNVRFSLTILTAALCHDLLEDTGVTEKEILETTNENVLKLVKELTNPSKGMNARRAIRKQIDRDHLLNASNDAKVIKLVDRICNLKDMKVQLKDMDSERDFLELYVFESRQLLDALKGSNEKLEKELLEVIESLS